MSRQDVIKNFWYHVGQVVLYALDVFAVSDPIANEMLQRAHLDHNIQKLNPVVHEDESSEELDVSAQKMKNLRLD